MQSPPATNDKTAETLPPVRPVPCDIWDVSDVPKNSICPNKKYIAFTFDDAPATTLNSIVETFLSFNQTHPDCLASATLFCNGMRCNDVALQALQTAYLAGFEMGNHSYHHEDLTKLSANTLQEEIDRTDGILQKIDGKPRHLLRTPFGCINDSVRAAAHTPIVSWTVDPLDWTGVSEEQIYQSIWSKKFDGAIILMHDGYENTVKAVKRLLPDLYENGYQVLSVSALSKANNCPLKKGGVYIRARKNGSAK